MMGSKIFREGHHYTMSVILCDIGQYHMMSSDISIEIGLTKRSLSDIVSDKGNIAQCQ